MVLPNTLEGPLYMLKSNNWEFGYFGLYLNDEQVFSLVQYYSKDNFSAKMLIVLESFQIQKEEKVKISDACVIYPFSILRKSQNLVLATESKQERARWLTFVSSPTRQKRACPINIQSFADPIFVCDEKNNVIGINTFMTKLLGKRNLLGNHLSVIMQLADLQKFSALCYSLVNARKTMSPHNGSFYFKSKGSCIDMPVRVSLLKGLNEFCFLCQRELPPHSLPSTYSYASGDNSSKLDELATTARDQSEDLITIMGEAFVSDSSGSSDESLQSRRLIENSNFQSLVHKYSASTLLQMQRTITFKNRRIVASEKKFLSLPSLKRPGYEALERTDGYSPRVLMKEATIHHSARPDESVPWGYLARRVAVVGGGNALLLGIELAITGSLVTIVEFQELRAEFINNGQWNMLDEVNVSPSGTAAASLLMDSPHLSLSASTDLKRVVEFSDIIVLETPFPFDKLFFNQIEQIESMIKPGQFLLLDCYCQKDMLQQVLSHVSLLIPSGTIMCATFCEDIPQLDLALSQRLERVVGIKEINIEKEINKVAKEFLKECNTSRMKNLTAGSKNSTIADGIGGWIFKQSRTHLVNLFDCA